MPEKEIWTCQNNWCTFSIGTLKTWYPMGYIDVGDGCWRPNVLVTIFWCWQQVTPPISNISHRHRILAYYDVVDRLKCHQHAGIFPMLSINVFQIPRTKHLHKQKQFSSDTINTAWRITKKVRDKFLLPIMRLSLVEKTIMKIFIINSQHTTQLHPYHTSWPKMAKDTGSMHITNAISKLVF